jgi:hypothetical protein
LSFENEDWIRDERSGDLIEARLFFKDGDGDQVRFDIDPDGELWVHAMGIVLMSKEDVETLLKKMRDVFALRVIT